MVLIPKILNYNFRNNKNVIIPSYNFERYKYNKNSETVFTSKKLDNSINIDFYSDSFKDSILRLDKSKTYYVYCRSGRRSLNTVEFMRENGFKESYNVDGGIIKWTDSKIPLK